MAKEESQPKWKRTKEIVADTQKAKCEQPGHTWARRTGLINDYTNGGSKNNNGQSPAILITAGFPCQPFSVAGKRQGERDDRYLWPQTITVIKEIKPSWILLENVTGIINLALDTVLSDLEGAGYSYETLIIPACAVNAWHRRDRVWIIANSEGTRTWQNDERIRQGIGGIDRGQEPVTANSRLLGQAKRELQTARTSQYDWWAVEPELGRVAYGIPNRVDRLKCLGNAIVPQVAYEIIKAILELDG